MADKQVKGFNYIVDKNSKILILGTLPPINRTFYYQKDKLFWQILGEVLGYNEVHNFSDEQKKNFLRENGVGLWDIFKSGYRRESSSKDTSIDISTVKTNKIIHLLNNYPNIKYILINGKVQAYEWFKEFNPEIDLSMVKNLYNTGTINRLDKSLKEKALLEWKAELKATLGLQEKTKPRAFVVKKKSDN